LLFSVPCLKIQSHLSGKVTDEKGDPLEGVSVILSGARAGTQTKGDGSFTLTVPKLPATLVFSYTGYTAINQTVTKNEAIQVAMMRVEADMGEVVVVGYQTVKRRDLTSSVSSVSSKDLKDIPVNSAADALAGRLAGVQITTSEGSPGATATIRVRGGGSITQDNSPLYVVDGVQVENALDVIAPQDIENVDVLKDASATAIYGARGANGVVIITTKSGKLGKPTITYNGMIGVRQLANKLEVMDPYEFVLYQYERSRGSAADRTSFLNTYGRWEDMELYKTAPFVDWQDEMFGRNALMQTHNVSLSGGNKETKYNLSLTSNTEEGVMQLSDFDRKLVNFKLDQVVSNKLRVGFGSRYNHTLVNGAGTSNEGSSGTNRLRHAVKYRPLLGGGQDLLDYDPDYALQTNANGLSLVNPILLNEAEYRQNISQTLNLNAYFTYTFNKYLSFRSTLGVDFFSRRSDAFNDTITSIARQNSNQPTASIQTDTRRTLNNSNVFTFTMSKSGSNFSNRNNLDIILGQEIFQNDSKNYDIETRYFPIGITAKAALGNMSLGSPPAGTSQPPAQSLELTNKLLSFFGRVNYALDDKYLFSLTMRADGSSKFAENNRWGYFPSASFAWRLSKERWLDGLYPTISDLKLRASYGEAGNNRINDFLYITQFTPSAFYSLNNQLITTFRSAALANANLVWETTIAKNLGLDVAFFNNRLNLTFDVYNNTTKDLLVNVPVPSSSGYTSQIQNVGSTSNKGFEIQLGGSPVQKKDFQWNVNFNISFNKNKIESLGGIQQAYLFSSGWGGSNQPADYLVRVGESVGTIWGLVTDGMYSVDDFDFNNGVYTLKGGVPNNQPVTATAPQPGMLKFKDLNGDGVVNDLDRTVIGNTTPKFFGGLNNQFYYKNFDLSVFLNFQGGNDVYNANKLEFTSGYTVNSNLLATMNNRWKTIDNNGVVVTDPGQLAKLNEGAALWQPLRSASSFYVHSWAVEDGSFLRINNITFGYTMPTRIASKNESEES
jgi:TonB-dependent starch-binding outer membrane protein SusC